VDKFFAENEEVTASPERCNKSLRSLSIPNKILYFAAATNLAMRYTDFTG